MRGSEHEGEEEGEQGEEDDSEAQEEESDSVEIGLAVENLTDTKWRSSEFFYASCVPSEVGAIPACPINGGGAGVEDFHFTPGNPRNVRGWIRYSF